MILSTRSIYLSGFVFIAGLLFFSLYLQFFRGVIPCPLCAFQRVVFLATGVFFLIAISVYKFRGARLISDISIIFCSLAGLVLAGRQIWLQQFPPLNGEECGVSLQYMMRVLPLHEVLQKVIFEGSAECIERGWEFMSINMAEWSFISFILLFFIGCITLYQNLTQR